MFQTILPTGILLAGVILQSCLAQESTTVVILGGGMSGVMAAKTFNDAGITDFIIVDSQAMLGGRMRKFDWIEGNATLELGAGWVHGTTGNPVWDLVQRFNISGSITDYDDYTARDANGQNVTAALDEAYARLEVAQEYEDALADDKYQNDGNDISKQVALRLGGWNPKSVFENAAEYFDYDFEYGVKTELTSLKYGILTSSTDFQDEDYRIVDQRGYRHIVQATADEFLNPDGSQLRFNERVIRIDTAGNRVIVTLSSGETIEAAYAISTFGVGALQSGNITYNPPLDYEKLETINHFKMAPYTKIFLKFPSQFWDDNEFIIYTSERKGFYTIWENLNHAKVLPGSNIIYATVTGHESERVEAMSDARIQSEAMGVLKAMYGDAIPEPDAIFVTRWLSDTGSYGSYTLWPIGFESEDHTLLIAPVRYLFFAGDHTHNRHWGEVTGAYYSGVEAATAVLDCINVGC